MILYSGYLDTTMPSEIMRSYLKTQDLMIWQALDIIEGSPVSINIKLKELKKLYESVKYLKEYEDIQRVENAIKRLEMSISLLDYDGIFTVEEAYFNYSSKEPDYGLEKVCANFEKVKEFIDHETIKYPPDIEECRWYNVIKWIKDKYGEYNEICQYYMVEKEILFSDIVNADLIENVNTEELETSCMQFLGDLRLPVPFNAGDLLEADGYPYGPKFRMMILEVGDNEDCCCVQGLAKNSEGRWESGAVKHGQVSFSYYPKISSLYSVKRFSGQLTDGESILYKVRDYISGKEENGKKLNDNLYNLEFVERGKSEVTNDDSQSGVTDEELRVLIEKLYN